MKQSGRPPNLPGANRPPQNIIDWAHTPYKRQLMGIHNVAGRSVWDRPDVDYLPDHQDAVQNKRFE